MALNTVIILVTIFYYMYFQTQFHHSSMTREQLIRMQLEHASRLDSSTGVLNKTAFTDTAKKLLSAPDIQPPSSLGFLFLDLDHLKELNDTLSHTVGDIAIADMADTIQSLCLTSDLIGRFGGDEFYVLLPDIPRQRLHSFLSELQTRLYREYSAYGRTVNASASIGAVYTEHIQDLSYEQLVQAADEALYEAKASGRNCHIIREL